MGQASAIAEEKSAMPSSKEILPPKEERVLRSAVAATEGIQSPILRKSLKLDSPSLRLSKRLSRPMGKFSDARKKVLRASTIAEAKSIWISMQKLANANQASEERRKSILKID